MKVIGRFHVVLFSLDTRSGGGPTASLDVETKKNYLSLVPAVQSLASHNVEVM
jgi:hypothetical protein